MRRVIDVIRIKKDVFLYWAHVKWSILLFDEYFKMLSDLEEDMLS